MRKRSNPALDVIEAAMLDHQPTAPDGWTAVRTTWLNRVRIAAEKAYPLKDRIVVLHEWKPTGATSERCDRCGFGVDWSAGHDFAGINPICPGGCP